MIEDLESIALRKGYLFIFFFFNKIKPKYLYRLKGANKERKT